MYICKYKILALFLINIFTCFVSASEKTDIQPSTLSSQANSRITPLTEVDSSRLEWSLKVANLANKYFNQPYRDATNKKDQYYALHCPDGTVVNRPNHSLAHGMRQAFIAVDIALYLQSIDESSLSTNSGKDLVKWVKEKAKNDKNFLRKLEFSNAFQRSGRQSEASRDSDEKLYESYLSADKQNFGNEAKNFIGLNQLFATPEEAEAYKNGIVDVFSSLDLAPNKDTAFLSKLFYSAHLFDLRRLPHFTKEKIIRNISQQLFGTKTPNEIEAAFVMKIWDRAGDYLRATGDRDMDNPRMSTWNAEVFCQQAHNSESMVKALHLARAQPEEKLFKSIVTHAEGMRELKENERFNKARQDAQSSSPLTPEEKNEKQKKSSALRLTLEQAPYTASEGYLKILLGNEFKEIPNGASEDEVKKITTLNVETFLKQEKKLKNSNKPELGFIPRVENPDSDYINILVNALIEERRNRGKIVFYHTTEPELAFLYDIYTQMRNQLKMEGVNDVRALRAVDNAFIKFDEDIQKEQPDKAQGSKATVFDFTRKYKGLADSSEIYKTLMLSTNFGLFGSDQQIWADTYNMFYLLKEDSKVTTRPPDAKKLFNYIQQYSGIEGNFEGYKKIMDRYILTCANGMSCRNGRLIQIFIDPEIANEIALFSVLMGAPVLKNDKNPPIEDIIILIRTNPEKVIEYLQDTKGAEVEGVSDSLLRPNTLDLHDLQARILLRPEYMFDKNLVIMKSYWRFSLPPPQEVSYQNEIKAAVNKDLAAWLQQGAPSREGGLTLETVNLKKFADHVYKGTTGAEPPRPVELAIEDQFARLIQDQKGDQAALMFEQNYNALRYRIFKVSTGLNGQGYEKMDLKDLLIYYAPMPVMKIAFEKGFFTGGLATYELYNSFKYKIDQNELLGALHDINNPALTSQLFLKYFKEYKGLRNLEVLKAIDKINNEVSIIELSLPFFKLFDYYSVDRVLMAVANIPADHRQSIIDETFSYINLENLSGYVKNQRALLLKSIMYKVYQLQNIAPEKRKLIWSISTMLGKNEGWDEILYLIEGIKIQEEEKLKAIDTNLKSSPDDKYILTLQKDFESSAFNSIYQPLISIFKGRITEQHIRKLLEDFSYIKKFQFKDIVDELVALLQSSNENNLPSAANNLKALIKIVYDMQYIIESQRHRNLIWELTLQLMNRFDYSWEDAKDIIDEIERLKPEILELLIKNNVKLETVFQWPKVELKWKKDTRIESNYGRTLSAPFTAEDVVNHASTYPSIYNMNYLQSEGGKLLISYVIEKLNNQLVPEDDFESIGSAYNRSNPSAGYNKSLIGLYVSELKNKN